MTFSQQAKVQILRAAKNLKGCCADAFLYAIFKAIGEFSLSGGGVALTATCQSNELLECCCVLVKNKCGITCPSVRQSANFSRNTPVYTAVFPPEILHAFSLTYTDSENLLQIDGSANEKFFNSACCKKAFVQGLFLSCGSATIPSVSGDLTESKISQRYHLEIGLTNAALFNAAADVLFTCGFKFKRVLRKNINVLYTKSSETIADFLVFLGAPHSKLQLENVLVERSLRNNANRQRNCITHNIDKMLNATDKQIEAIEKLQKSGALYALAPHLLEIAKLRTENPEASLAELSESCGITKSGVKHRLQKLIDLANAQSGCPEEN